jgi:hypothetical protein
MRRPINRYSDYDDRARAVLVRAGEVAERDGQRSVGLQALRLGLLEVGLETEASLSEAGVEPQALAAIDGKAKHVGGATEKFREVLAAAESAAILDGRGQVMVADLLAGLVAITRPSSSAASASGAV